MMKLPANAGKKIRSGRIKRWIDIVSVGSPALSMRPGMVFLAVVLGVVLSVRAAQKDEAPAVSIAGDGRLSYRIYERGDRIPDFSHCGYMGLDEPIPDVPVRVVVFPVQGDNTRRIQTAIDYVASLPIGAGGVRGAVLLLEGRYEIFGGLKISASGVVLRGRGMGTGGTVLVIIRGHNNQGNQGG